MKILTDISALRRIKILLPKVPKVAHVQQTRLPPLISNRAYKTDLTVPSTFFLGETQEITVVQS